jgi:hypothetical protein
MGSATVWRPIDVGALNLLYRSTSALGAMGVRPGPGLASFEPPAVAAARFPAAKPGRSAEHAAGCYEAAGIAVTIVRPGRLVRALPCVGSKERTARSMTQPQVMKGDVVTRLPRIIGRSSI